MEIKRRSSLWFLLPIFMGVIGGIIAYFVIKEDDPKRAKSCLYLGIILAAVGIAVFVIPFMIGIALFPQFPMMHDIHYM
jgi:hypothetical protein